MVTRLGLLRNIRSAICSMYFSPPAASKIDAHVTTARIINITVMGGEVGGMRKINTSTNRPNPETTPSPIPPKRLPAYSTNNRNKNSKYNMTYFPIYH